jgi:hypothetical protein
MLRRLFAFLPCLVLLACGTKATTPSSVDSLCAATDPPKCIGNVSAACAPGGKTYDITQCGVDKFCNATTGKCEATVCEKSSSKCAGSDSSNVCNADGSVVTVKSCAANERCLAGICVTSKCGGTQTKCGWNAVLTCTATAWGKQDCGADEFCDPATTACKKRACDPGSPTQCNDDKTSAAHCSDTGDAWVVENCGAGNVCENGVCHAQVNSTTVEDTSSGTDDGMTLADVGKDGKTTMELPPKDSHMDDPDKFEVIVSQSATAPDGAVPTKFSNVSAAWLDSLGMLQISGAEGSTKVEIQVAKIEEFATGDFTAVGGEAPDSKLGYSDGTGAVTGGKFQYNAADYTITIDEFGDMGGRIRGSFSGQLADDGGKKIWLIDGKFDIKR